MQERIRVLHVDDDDAFAALTAEMLETKAEAITVETANSASEGLEVLAEGGIDCVVSDYEMPGTDGIEFLRAVRERYPELPFVLFTGKGSETVAAEAVEAGVSGYMQKSGTDTFDLLRNRIRSEVDDRRTTAGYRQYKTVIDSLTDPVYVVDEEGTFTDINAAFLELTGYDEEEIIGSHASMIKPPEDVEYVEARIERLLDEDDPSDALLEVDILTAEGDPVPCTDHLGIIRSDDGRFQGSVGVLHDVSGRQRSEKYRRELYETASEPGLETEDRCRRMLELGRQRLGLAEAKLVRTDPEAGTHETVIAATDTTREGRIAELSRTYCRRIVETGEPVAFHDAERAGWTDDVAHEEYGFACYAGTRVDIDGERYGTICFTDVDSRKAEFSDAELTFIELVSRMVERELERRRIVDSAERREKVLQEVQNVVTDRTKTHEERIRGLLELGSETLGTEYAIVSRIRDDRYRFDIVEASGDAIGEGDVLPLSEAGCELTVAERELQAAADLSADPRYEEHPIHTEHGQNCYIGTPVYRDDQLYGTLCFTAPEERERSFERWEKTVVELMSQWIGYAIAEREAPDAAAGESKGPSGAIGDSPPVRQD